MTFEQAKGIIQRMAHGTVTPEEESRLEAWAVDEWGHTPDVKEIRIVLSTCTPRSAGNGWWHSVRQCLEWCRETAQFWCDIQRMHRQIGWTSSDGVYYGEEVFACEYREKIQRPAQGNFGEMECWRNGEYSTLASFRCAEGQAQDEKDYDTDTEEPCYLFENTGMCDNCLSIKKFPVVCAMCLEKLLASGDCVMSKWEG